jgi:hypothetical protein
MLASLVSTLAFPLSPWLSPLGATAFVVVGTYQQAEKNLKLLTQNSI